MGTKPSFRYVYTARCRTAAGSTLFTPYRGSDFKLKRWHRIESWSAVFFCAAAAFLFYPGAELRDWLRLYARGCRNTDYHFLCHSCPRASWTDK